MKLDIRERKCFEYDREKGKKWAGKALNRRATWPLAAADRGVQFSYALYSQ